MTFSAALTASSKVSGPCRQSHGKRIEEITNVTGDSFKTKMCALMLHANANTDCYSAG
jgi:hypothetical protein